jgi:NAD(P) transhydrogenase subunit alpha
MANIGGYKGVLLASVELNRYFPMHDDGRRHGAAGQGVRDRRRRRRAAGDCHARRLGANVVATDVRPEVKEQIESVGAKYVGIELKESAAAGGGYAKELSAEDRARQSQLLAEECAQSDVVITTALIGGVFAPRLINADTVRAMKPARSSSIWAPTAAATASCPSLARRFTSAASRSSHRSTSRDDARFHASLLFSRNLTRSFWRSPRTKRFQLDLSDDIQQGALITHEGNVTHARTREALDKR